MEQALINSDLLANVVHSEASRAVTRMVVSRMIDEEKSKPWREPSTFNIRCAGIDGVGEKVMEFPAWETGVPGISMTRCPLTKIVQDEEGNEYLLFQGGITSGGGGDYWTLWHTSSNRQIFEAIPEPRMARIAAHILGAICNWSAMTYDEAFTKCRARNIAPELKRWLLIVSADWSYDAVKVPSKRKLRKKQRRK